MVARENRTALKIIVRSNRAKWKSRPFALPYMYIHYTYTIRAISLFHRANEHTLRHTVHIVTWCKREKQRGNWIYTHTYIYTYINDEENGRVDSSRWAHNIHLYHPTLVKYALQRLYADMEKHFVDSTNFSSCVLVSLGLISQSLYIVYKFSYRIIFFLYILLFVCIHSFFTPAFCLCCIYSQLSNQKEEKRCRYVHMYIYMYLRDGTAMIVSKDKPTLLPIKTVSSGMGRTCHHQSDARALSPRVFICIYIYVYKRRWSFCKSGGVAVVDDEGYRIEKGRNVTSCWYLLASRVGVNRAEYVQNIGEEKKRNKKIK